MRRSTTLAAIALRVCLTVLAAAGLAALAGPGLVALAGPVSALAATPAKLSATFVPERLGQRTTLDFGFAFSAPSGQVPPPLTEIELRYPDNLGIALSGLGLEDCSTGTLEASGPAGCPANSVMGFGQAFVGIVLGTTTITETTLITIVRAPDQDGHLAVLFYAEGSTPVATHIIFAGLLLPASAPFGGLVSIGVPLVPTLPGAPYFSVIHLRATIGPRGVTYYERRGGLTLAYRPRGILLPLTCPRAGFQFAALFTFQEGSDAPARTTVPCPQRRARRPRT